MATCKTCDDTGTVWVECPCCIDPISHDRDTFMKNIRCPECWDKYNGKVPVDCPNCNPEKLELPVELL